LKQISIKKQDKEAIRAIRRLFNLDSDAKAISILIDNYAKYNENTANKQEKQSSKDEPTTLAQADEEAYNTQKNEKNITTGYCPYCESEIKIENWDHKSTINVTCHNCDQEITWSPEEFTFQTAIRRKRKTNST